MRRMRRDAGQGHIILHKKQKPLGPARQKVKEVATDDDSRAEEKADASFVQV
jgi:hypothetical protein